MERFSRTKMNSYLRNKSRNSNDTPLFVAFIAIVLVALFVFGVDKISGGAVRSLARQGGGTLFATVSSALSQVRGSGALSFKRALVEENTQLKDALAQHEEEALRFEFLRAENDALR